MAAFVSGYDTSGVSFRGTTWTGDPSATNVVTWANTWDVGCDYYYEPSTPEPRDETAQQRRRLCIESFLVSLHRRAWLLLGRQSAGCSQIRRERVWRPPRV